MKGLRFWVTALLCAQFYVLCASAHAATFVVTTNSDTATNGICEAAGTGDGCTLREAIQAANNAAGADSITFNSTAFSTAQTIALNGTVLPPIAGDLTLTGPAARLTIDAGGAANGLQINSGNVRISGLTVTGASNVNGGIFQNFQSGATLTLTNITLSGNSLGLYIASGSATVINSTINDNHNPSGCGGIFNGAGSTLNLNRSTISGNSGDYDIGGIYNGGGSTLTVNNCTISGNSARFNGGGIYSFGTVTLTNSTISGNSAGSGGGGIYTRSGSTLNIGNTILNNNTGGNLSYGGTLNSQGCNISSDPTGPNGPTDRRYTDPQLGPLADNGGPTLTHALLSGSPAIDAGNGKGLDQRGRERPFDVSGVANVANGSDIGAVEQGATATAQSGPNFVVNSTSSGTSNEDDGMCGTMHCSLREALNAANNDGVNSAVTFHTTIFAAPRKVIPLNGLELSILRDGTLSITAPTAGVEINGTNQNRVFSITGGADVTLSGLTISGGNSPDSGGGIANFGTLALTNSTLTTNNAGINGGAIVNLGGLTMTNSSLIGNRANNNGGGIYNLGGLTVTNSTFSVNSAGPNGGGIYNLGLLTMTNSTLSANHAGLGGGIYNSGPLTMGNTILSGFSNLFSNGPITSQGYNISSDGTGPNNGTTDKINTDPKLGPLVDNGGPTPTHALLAGSPALNAGNSTLTTDQRGVARPQGARADIGAYEALYLQIGDASLTEGNSGTTNMTFTVTLSGAVSAPVSLNYAVSSGTARSGSDFGAPPSDSDGGTSGTLMLAPNQTTGTITVPIIGDLLDEPNELFYLVLSSPMGALLSRGRATGTINDNDLPPSISVDNVTVVEGHSGGRYASFTLRLSVPSGQVVRVTAQSANGTATSGSDYIALPPTVINFTTGATSTLARVEVRGDMLDEPNETVFLNLSTPVNATLADNQGQASITDDDATPSLTINDVSIAEGNGGTKTLSFTVTKTGQSANTITVNYASANGGAQAGTDYVATSGTLTFAPGSAATQTISITINGDTAVEANEVFYVILSGAANAAVGRARGVGTITNDDAS